MQTLKIVVGFVGIILFSVVTTWAESDPSEEAQNRQTTEALQAVKKAFGDGEMLVWPFRVTHGKDHGQLLWICARLEEIKQKSATLEKAKETLGISPESLPKDADIILERLGKELVEGVFLAMKNVPQETLDRTHCPNTTLSFKNGIDVVEAVINAMLRVGIRPTDSDAEEKFREFLLNEFRRQVVNAREDKEQGKPHRFFSTILRAADEYYFSGDQLWLSPKEKEDFAAWVKARLAGNPVTVTH